MAPSAAALTRERLLTTTWAQVARHGFLATTAQVAAATGRSAGTLHRHFATKDDLLLAALDHALAALAVPDPSRVPGEAVHARLRRHWHAAGHQALAHPLAFRYWALYAATPGLPVGHLTPRQVRAEVFRGAEPLLAAAYELPSWGTWAAAWLVASWESTVAELLARAADGPDAAAELTRGFNAWWAGLGLAHDMPVPTEPA
jgi:AcrR family transcriptional regulator